MINQTISGMVSRTIPRIVSGASPSQTMTQKMAKVADKIDKNNTGNVTKEQFAAAFKDMPMPIKFKSMGADALFDKVDPEKKGNVSKQDFASRMKDVILQTRFQGTSSANSNSNANASATTGKFTGSSQSQSPSQQAQEAATGNQAASTPTDQRTGNNVNVYA
jgi:hypothetical protein